MVAENATRDFFGLSPLVAGSLGFASILLAAYAARPLLLPVAAVMSGVDGYMVWSMLAHGVLCPMCVAVAVCVQATLAVLLVARWLRGDRIGSVAWCIAAGGAAVFWAGLRHEDPAVEMREESVTAVGHSGATVRLEVFLSPGCPYCMEQETQLESLLASQLDVEVVYRDLVFDDDPVGVKTVREGIRILVERGSHAYLAYRGGRGDAPLPSTRSMDPRDLSAILSAKMEKDRERARRLGVVSVPTIVLMYEGKVVARSTGLVSHERLDRMISDARTARR